MLVGGAVRLGAQPLSRDFLCALAGAAFLAEHAWAVEPDEAERVEQIRAVLAERLAGPSDDLGAAEDLLLLASLYGRIGRLPGADRLADLPESAWSPPFVAVVREQVLEPLEERAIAAALPALTPIDDGVSASVRAMYEVNPYPRWRAARYTGPVPLASIHERVRPGIPVPAWPTPLPVLVAGAGTGQHPIQAALRLPDADVLAIDLSRASLAYGARMARKLGVPNIRFAQADILALDALDRQFALIECAGVLHHLEDPLAGWAVLRRLLRPDGLMLIALYSELARQDVVAARALIAAFGLPSTPDGIRTARRLIAELPPEHPASAFARILDFYSESGFRDLAMHVQEHRFTIPRIAESLDALHLRFLGFMLAPETLERFRARFPTPGAELDLSCWDEFEHENPTLFEEMYQFWCGPR
jgi:SAM-dependent methyltransferase